MRYGRAAGTNSRANRFTPLLEKITDFSVPSESAVARARARFRSPVTLVATAAAILPQFLREIIGSPNIATRVENSRFLLPNGARVPGQDRIPRSCSQPT